MTPLLATTAIALASAGTALTAAVLAVALGSGVAHALGRALTTRGPRAALWTILTGVALAPLAVPPVAFAGVVSDLTGVGPAPATGDAGAILRHGTLTVAYALGVAPLAGMLLWIALRNVPEAADRAARLLAPSRRAQLVLWPHLRTPLGIVVVLCAILVATDAGAPSHFGVRTVASEASARYLTDLDPLRAIGAILVPWMLTLVVGVVALTPRRDAATAARGRVALPGGGVALTIAIVCGLVGPLAHCAHVADAAIPLRTFLDRSMVEAGGIFGGAALLTAGLLALGSPVAIPGRHVAARALTLLPLAAPGFVLGTGALALATSLPPELEGVAWWSGFGLRSLPWVGLALLLRGIGPQERALASLALTRGRLALLRLRTGGLAVAFLGGALASAAALREVGFPSAFSRPGAETLAFRGAQELHYGFTPPAATILATMLGLGVVWGVVTTRLLVACEGRP